MNQLNFHYLFQVLYINKTHLNFKSCLPSLMLYSEFLSMGTLMSRFLLFTLTHTTLLYVALLQLFFATFVCLSVCLSVSVCIFRWAMRNKTHWKLKPTHTDKLRRHTMHKIYFNYFNSFCCKLNFLSVFSLK